MIRSLPILCMVLAGAGLVQGTVLTVGPDGTYSTIQQAINVAAVGDDTEIRVEGGNSYLEALLVPTSFTGGSIELTGGWDATFSVRDPHPGNTFIDGFNNVRPLEVRLAGGQFTLDGFTIKKGLAADGGGLYADLDGSEKLVIESCRIRENHAVSTGGLQARGGAFQTTGSASLTIEGSGIALNSTSGDSAPQVFTVQEDSSLLTFRDSGVGWSDAMGIRAFANDSSQIHLVNLTVADNATTGLSLHRNGTSTFTLYNTIAFNNGTDLSTVGIVDTGFNLIGIDPMFVNPDELDYRLRPGSPAENTGTNTPARHC